MRKIIMFKRKVLSGACLLAIAATVSTPVGFADSAQNVATDATAVQETVVVVGQYLYADQVNALKTPTPIIDVPQSLSIVTADQITQQGFTSIGDIINYTPGVSMSQGEGHRDAVVFRGVRSTADFFIDGVRDDVQYYRPLYNLEQVEILRGPNALLFGRGGTGGILNRVTKKAAIGEQFTGYQAGIDTFGAYDLQVDSNFDVNDQTAVRVNAMYESLDNHRDFYDGERFGINPTAKIAFSPTTVLDLSYEYVDHERFIDRGIPTGADGEPVEEFEDIVFGDPERNINRLEAHLLRAMLQHQFSDNLKGRFSAFYGDYDKFYQNFYASSFDPATNIVGIDGYVDTTQRQNFNLSADLIGEFETGRIGHTIVAGVEYIDTTNDNDRFNPVWTGSNDDVEFFDVTEPLNLSNGAGINANGEATSMTFSDLNDDTAATVEVFSAYVQDEIEVSEHLDLIVGLRFDSFDIEVDNLDPSNLETRSRLDEEVSPRLGLVYKPQENISLYASYSESFLPRSGEQFANINGDADALEPDEFTNLEAGLKWDLQPGLSLTAAVFEIEQSSPQVADDDPETLDVIDSETTGFEIQLQGQVTDRWFVSTGYSYLDGEQVDRSGPTGLRPRELPENMFSLWNTYQVTDQFGLGLGVTYQDESFINNANTAVLPSYTRVDAAAFYDVSDRVRLQLNVENVTDELYFPDAHSTHQATVGAPLNARLTVSGRF
ncbi:MAG: TonB-dependent siderophore receptor [Henriciella sp.]|nr:TonB-dependent siderophore receptor [Henriciella sp.]